jgi:hypothetical protein
MLLIIDEWRGERDMDEKAIEKHQHKFIFPILRANNRAEKINNNMIFESLTWHRETTTTTVAAVMMMRIELIFDRKMIKINRWR